MKNVDVNKEIIPNYSSRVLNNFFSGGMLEIPKLKNVLPLGENK